MKEIKYLNGLRSLAVISVIIYHFNYSFLNGGFLGVDIFFIISGFLISTKLVRQLDNDEFKLVDFYENRFFRIYPSLIFMIIVTLLYILLFENYIFGIEKTTGIFSILGINNYFQIFTNVDYFEKSIFPMPFIHMWSLAIEIQFYILFPLLISKMYKLNIKRYINKVLIILILISFSLMIFIFNNVSINWAYYGSFSRMFSLIMGSMVGINYKKITIWIKNHINKYVINIFSIIILIIIFEFLFKADGSSKFMYDLGFFLFSILTSLLVILLGSSNSLVKKFLSLDIFKFIATRSYNYYLWHIPILILMPNVFPLIQLIIILLISEFVYRKIEIKMIKRDFSLIKENKILISFIIIILFIIPSSFLTIESKEKVKEVNSSENIYSIVSYYENLLLDPSKILDDSINSFKNYKEGNELINRQSIYVFGDSIIEGIEYVVKENYPSAVVNAKVGILTDDLIEMMEPYSKYDSYNTIIIFDAGNNDLIEEKDLNKIKSLFKKSTIIAVDSSVDKWWSKKSNENIENYLSKNKGAMKLVKWSEVKNKKELVTGDQVHLTSLGIKEYSKLIEKAMYESLGIEYIK